MTSEWLSCLKHRNRAKKSKNSLSKKGGMLILGQKLLRTILPLTVENLQKLSIFSQFLAFFKSLCDFLQSKVELFAVNIMLHTLAKLNGGSSNSLSDDFAQM